MLDENPLVLTEFVVESLEVVLDEKLLLEEKQSMGKKSLLDEKPPDSTEFVVESLEVVLDEKLLLGEKTICGGGKSCWMKTSELDCFNVCRFGSCSG